MTPNELYETYEEVSDAFEASWDDQGSVEFSGAVERLKALAEQGVVEAIEGLAEILAPRGPLRNPEAAYRWYFISYSAQGYKTEFAEQPGPHYMGPVGDFRNEAPVIDLVDQIGLARVRELDGQELVWLRDHRVFFTDPRDDRTRDPV